MCAPVTITPIVNPEIPTATCSKPIMISNDGCEFTETSCKFHVTQRICVGVPLSFSATVAVGEESVSCGTPSESFCTNCSR